MVKLRSCSTGINRFRLVGINFLCSDSLGNELILIGLVDQLFLTSSELELKPSIGNFNQINQNRRFDWLFVLRIAYFPYYVFLESKYC